MIIELLYALNGLLFGFKLNKSESHRLPFLALYYLHILHCPHLLENHI